MNPKDPVEEASYESFPASDPPAFGRPARDGDTIPPGQPVPKKATKATGGEEARAAAPATGKRRNPALTGQNVSDASAEAERRADRQADRDAVHERDRSGS